MATFPIYEPGSEKELHQLIINDLDAIEEGLTLLEYEKKLEMGIPDILCVDSGGRLTIIEVKLFEDENILFQGLRYYADVDKIRYQLTDLFSDKGVIGADHPRVILVAKTFSDYVKKLCSLVIPSIELFEYQAAADSNGKKGVIFHNVSLPKDEDISLEVIDIESHKNYLTNEKLLPAFEKARRIINDSFPHSIENPRKSYIGYYYQGRQFAWLGVQRKSFDFGSHKLDDDKRVLSYSQLRIKDPSEMDGEKFTLILDEMKESFRKLGGVPKQ